MSVKFEYSVESVSITSSSGKVYEVKDLVTSIDFYESLNSPYIKCEVSIIDAAGMIELFQFLDKKK